MSRPPLILVVDDEASMRDLVVDILESEGYAVAVARNGQQALDYLQRVRPAAVLLDLMMPVLDGWTFMERYREVAGAEIPAIGFSATMNPMTTQRLSQLGVQACLAKPFDVADLLESVARAVRRPAAAARGTTLARRIA